MNLSTKMGNSSAYENPGISPLYLFPALIWPWVLRLELTALSIMFTVHIVTMNSVFKLIMADITPSQ